MTRGLESVPVVENDKIDGDWKSKLKSYIGERNIHTLSESEQVEIHTRLVAWPNLPQPSDEVQQMARGFLAELAKKDEFDKIVHSTHKELITCIGDMNFILRNMFLSSGNEKVKEICNNAKNIACSRLRRIFSSLEDNLGESMSVNNLTSAEKPILNPLTPLYGSTSRLGCYCGLIYYLTDSKLPTKEILAGLLGIRCEREQLLPNIPTTSQGYKPYTTRNPCTYVPYKSVYSILWESDTDTYIGSTTTKVDQAKENFDLYFTLEDYLMSLLKMSCHLSELATTFAARGDYEVPKVILEFLVAIQQGFMLLQLRNGPIRRMYDRLKYEVKDVGNLIYELGSRLEIYSRTTDLKNTISNENTTEDLPTLP